jgi:hypothetical protein
MWRPPLLRGAVVVALGSAVLGATAASAGACPNDALRLELHSGQLPDCRAYELVSPAYKEGVFISSAFAVSPDGSRFLAASLGVFGGAEGDGLGVGTNLLGVSYVFSRDERSGWTAASLEPPASKFRSNGFFDASADLSATVWELSTIEPAQPEGVTDLYLERPRGVFEKIGPATPDPAVVNAGDYRYLGASAELSHVLFSVKPGFRWPFDGTIGGGGTLYEYVGVQQPKEVREPSLVGVNGDRGSAALISQCGTRLGSSAPEEGVSGSLFNAISASGARVFFTAVGKDEAPGCAGEAPPVGELFAREELPLVNGEAPAAHMRSVPISEPLEEDCKACLAGGVLKKDAVFQGASLDGSKVFFTTEQELLPGAEGTNLYEYDFDAPAGEKISRASVPLVGQAEVQGLARISEDGSHVYFVARGILTEAPNGVEDSAIAGEDNLYVYERDARFPTGRTSFVATLVPGDSGDWAPADERPVLSSRDGGFLVFTSVADLTNETLNGNMQVFQFDAATGGLVRASAGQNGYNENDRTPVVGSNIVDGFPSSYSYAHVDSPTSANGVQAPEDGAVFFESPDPLTPLALADRLNSAGQNVSNIYEYRAGNVYLLSDGRDVSTLNATPGVFLIGSDPSGGDVFFYMVDSLIGRDGDTEQDIYDARAEGGIPEPALTPGCVGETCQGTLAAAPALAPLGGSAIQATEAEALPPAAVPVKPKPKAKVKGKKPIKKKGKARARQRARKAGLHGRTQEIVRPLTPKTMR